MNITITHAAGGSRGMGGDQRNYDTDTRMLQKPVLIW